jgi:hypothetical protein
MDNEQLKVLDKIANDLYNEKDEYKNLNEFDQAIWDCIHLYFYTETTEQKLLVDLGAFPFSQEEINNYYDEITNSVKFDLSLPAFDYISNIIYNKGVEELGIETLEDLFE